ncbi:MAG: amidohydrolase family protein [Verrucomicrobiales bacterium]|jgi:L-fuconolactonase|nr:amidohydrolase family protein [Verrucomicrobiales bacterium]
MIIDAHQHFWKPSRGDYGWLTPELELLYRDFLPRDLKPLLDSCGVEKTILVQAAPTRAETEFMLELAREHEFIAGVVGWIDFEAADAAAQIGDLSGDPLLLGLRPMIQDIPDVDWILRSQNEAAFAAMVNHHLVFDALVLPIHLKNLLSVVVRFPDLRVVIDHAAKPSIRTGVQESWFREMEDLAQHPQVSCKVSGLVTEAGPDWKPGDLTPVIDHLIAVFGPNRLIWGSDWPVLNLAGDYGQWFEVANEALQECTETDRSAVFGGNAERIYLTP